jgi:hypothetical protein
MEKDFDELPLHNQEEELTDQQLTQFFAQNAKTFRQQLLDQAIGFLGVSRETDINQVEKFLALFNLPTKQNGKWVPFCAAGVSYTACKAWCISQNEQFTVENSLETFRNVKPDVNHHYFLPNASCGMIMQDAQHRGTWIPKDSSELIMPGYLVLYSWTGSNWPDHIGVVELHAQQLHTVEFNTSTANNINGGAVSRRVRNYNCVLGYIKL